MKQSQDQVNYRRSILGIYKCGNCSMFQPPAGCTAVAGTIHPHDICDLWKPWRKWPMSHARKSSGTTSHTPSGP